MGLLILTYLIIKWSIRKLSRVLKDIFLLTRRFCKEHWERIKATRAYKVLCRVVDYIEKIHLFYFVLPEMAKVMWDHVHKFWPW